MGLGSHLVGMEKGVGVRIVVTGGRNYSDYEAVKRELDEWLALADAMQVGLIVIEGGATGADALARRWCEENPDSVRHIREDAKWTDLDAVPCVPRRRKDGTLYNAAAGGIRNQKMLDAHLPSVLLQFPGGKGTADMVKRAHAAKVRVKECT